jgi:hypothetical protein
LVGRAFGEDVWTGRAVITDSAGKFLMDNLPPGPGTFKLSFRPAFADHGVEPVEYDLCLDPSDEQVTLTAGKREQVTLHLMRTLAITGTALDAAGKPVGGVMVSASLPQNEAESAGVTWTAEDGTYNLNGLPPGEYAVRAERHPTEPDAPPERLTRTVPAGSTRVDFRFSK